MTPKETFYRNQADLLIKRMDKRNIDALYAPDAKTAVKECLGIIKDEATVSWGGSMTVQDSGLINALGDRNVTLIDRESAATPEEKVELCRRGFFADYYLMSTNAITLEGEIVNIDGVGNRVAALCYGPDKVIVMAGMNKVTADRESAIKRIHNTASPMNALRLGVSTPCAQTGACGECHRDDSLCSQIVITRRSRPKGRITVILIGEELGY